MTARWRAAARCAVLLSILAASACREAAPDGPRPNVVVVMIDTLRPDHLGFAGYERETAPFLASLASEGTVFERAFSTSSWTAPATASLFTGLYPQRHGVVRGFFAHFHEAREEGGDAPAALELDRLPERHATLPEVFAAAGYRTYGLSTNLNIGPEIGFERGFDRFERLDDVPAARLFERLDAWRGEIFSEREEPYLLYLHLNDPHSPYRARQPWFQGGDDERSRRVAAYDSEISYLDLQLRRLFAEHELGPDTLVAVVSDHGEEFLDHGGWFHGFSLHRELNQILFLLHAPELGIAARRVPVNVSLVDVLPTLVELAGLGAAARERVAGNGRSLAPLVTSEELAPAALARFDERPLFAHRAARGEKGLEHTWAVLRGRWKLYEIGGERRLYDLWGDPAERRDVAAQEPEAARALGELLDREQARGIDRHGAAGSVELDEELLERLSELGYVK